MLISLELQVFFRLMNASIALPILPPTSASVRPCLSTILPKYVEESTSSCHGWQLFLVTFDLTLLIFNPALADVAACPVVLSCIW